uniref:Peptidase S1 domain-containing protein n=1 Tax=Cuerna arida TaxID=1464854 RepID=A0A1B6GE75_9HEMI
MHPTLQALYKYIVILTAIVNDFHVHTQETRPFLNTYLGEGKVPFVVYVNTVVKGGMNKKCTGTLLDKNWVLTLASCVDEPSNTTNVTVQANLISYDVPSPRSQLRLVVEVYPHPLYKPDRLAGDDIALLMVQHPFVINEYVQPIPVFNGIWPIEDGRPAKIICSVLGYGNIDYTKYDSKLKVRRVQATHSDSCACTRRNQWMNLVCLDPMDDVGLCSVDNGAPLVYEKKLIGINHILMVKSNCTEVLEPDNICGDYSVVSYFLYMCPYLDWMKSMVVTLPDQPQYCNSSPPSTSGGTTLLVFLFAVGFL